MKEAFLNIYDAIMNAITLLGPYGPLLASLFIIFESMIPPLPLFVFITINFVAFGKLYGFILSWMCTIIGCSLSYYLSKKFFYKHIKKRIRVDGPIDKCLGYIKRLSLTQITVFLSIPFTPAFAMNVAAALAGMEYKKFFIALVISKIFLIYFWGIIGTSFIDSLHNPKSMITIVVMVLLAFIISKITKKVFKMD